jgi:hypothetical protein
MPTAPFHPAAIVLAMVMVTVLTACGGGAGGGGGSGPAIMLSGTATFASVPTSASGLDYGAATSKPIRTAVVQVRNASGNTVLYESSTDAAGNWTIAAPQSTAVLVMVVSRLGTPSAVTARVVNNLNGDAIYAVYVARTTGIVDETGIALHAGSGWDGDSYGSARAAAPFAILDVVYQAQQLIRSADAGAAFPLLTIGWSTNNSTATIGTSHYSPSTGRLAILGKEDEDTDEYDTHVIAHEWGHWFEDNFSRSDSLGGPHGSGDILDETVAFGEGWGNAFSGMVMSDPDYIDTMGVEQSSSGVVMDLEDDSISDSATVGGGDSRKLDGGWSETSVQELLWDAYDGGPGALADTDADGVSLGFTPLYNVLVGPQKTFGGFTSIYSFMYHLKAANAGSSAAITTLEAAENIGAHDAHQQTAAGFARYTQVRNDGVAVTHDVDGQWLTTYDTYGEFTGYEENKLYNRMLFTATAPSNGTFRVRVTPLNLAHDVSIRFGGPSQALVDAVYGGSEFVNISATTGAQVVFSVTSYPIAGNPSGVTPFQVQFGTVGAVGKPQAELPPPMPVGNG